MHTLLRTLFPFLSWLRLYRLEDLKIDLAAGLSVALVLMPQSMANAQIAGLPAYHGLYAPAVVAGLWGSSREMVTGIGAVVAIMAASALSGIPMSGPGDYIAYMALLTLMVGAFQLVFGLLRMGALVNFLSHPVISGFINASAFIIAASQLGKLLGIAIEPTGSEIGNLLAVLSSARHFTHWPSVFMALIALAVILPMQRYMPKAPAILAAVVLTTFLSWIVGFEKNDTVTLAQVQSEEVRGLVSRLNKDMTDMAAASQAIARLKQDRPETQAGMLEQHYRIMTQQLAVEQARNDAALVREHLRRMTFVAERQEDGSRLYYVKERPDKAHRAGQGIGPEQTAAKPETASLAPGDGNSAKGSGVRPLPADDFLDGIIWRLSLGAQGLDPDALLFAGGGKVVGRIPAGLPGFSMPNMTASALLTLFPQALIIALLAFAESISIAKSAAIQKGYRLNANQQLVSLGMANVAGGLVLTCPVSGSFSSSAVNLSAGARTGLSSVFAGLGALLVLLFFTPALRYLPEPVLAAVVMRAVVNLVDFKEFKRAWDVRRSDGVIAVVTFAATLAFAPHMDYGIAVGIVLSLASYFYRSMHPTIAALSCGPDNLLRNARVFGLEECRHIAIIQFQGSLFFANASLLENYVLDRLEKEKDLRHMHFICSGITSIDASGEESLVMLVDRAHKAGVQVSFSGVIGSVADVLERMGVLSMLGDGNFFLTPREAVCAIHKQIQHDEGCEKECPLTNIFCHKRERGRHGTAQTASQGQCQSTKAKQESGND